MARSSMSRSRVVISGDSLNGWKKLGAGGFGDVYEAIHDEWGPVAIKVIKDANAGSISDEDLKREAEMMKRAVSLHVTKVLGAFRGRLPDSIEHVGMVMELMERGSLQSLLKDQRPPWPLVFRLVHQVALGMNHLHSLTPEALIHKDLKPDNVLLDSDLNVKISDFGLAKYADNMTVTHLKGGRTHFYAPPEYAPPEYASATRAFDVYSYAMLVFVILNAGHSTEKFDKNKEERPSLKVINGLQAQGVKELVKLMVRCWDQTPENRPSFAECARETARLYEMHKSGIQDAVRRMKRKLDGTSSSSNSHGASSSSRNSHGASSSSENSGYKVTFHGGNSSSSRASSSSSRVSSGRVKYGELIVLGHSDSSTKSHFTLYQRPEANGVKPSNVHKGSNKSSMSGQSSMTFVTPVSTVIVDFEDDRNTDMFQIGRATDSQIDFRVTDTVSTSSSDISRYACRIICQRSPPYTAHIYAAGFNSNKNIFLGKDAVKWESHGQMDGLTTNGVLVMQPLRGFTPGPWREISVFGNAFTPRDSPTSRQRGKRVSSEPQELVDGSLIDLCGVTLLWRTSKSPIENLNALLRDLPR